MGLLAEAATFFIASIASVKTSPLHLENMVRLIKRIPARKLISNFRFPATIKFTLGILKYNFEELKL